LSNNSFNPLVILVQGLVGGCGATTVAANLATAIKRQGINVVAIDLSLKNDLRFHFGMDVYDPNGLVRNIFKAENEEPIAFQSHSGVIFFPFGELSFQDGVIALKQLLMSPLFIDNLLENIEFNFPLEQKLVVILNVDTIFASAIKNSLNAIHQEILVANTTSASLVQLVTRQAEFNYDKTKLVINQFSPHHDLDKDIQILMVDHWLQKGNKDYKTLYHDQFVAEALAQNSNVIDYFEDAKSAKDYYFMAIQFIVHSLQGN
jgi:cellulose synthase operon protein YhjQ